MKYKKTKTPEMTISVSFLGNFRMELEGNVLTDEINRSQKLWGVLSYLILNRNRSITIAELIDQFWPSSNSTNPVSALKTLLYRIRTMLEPFFGEDAYPIVSQRGSYSWNGAIRCDVDIDRFALLYNQAQGTSLSPDKKISLLRSAVALYRGDFLPAQSGQLWVVSIAERYHRMYLDSVKQLAALLEERECDAEIFDLCMRASEFDPLDEALHILIVRTYIRQGNEAAALSHYEKATDMLYRNLGVRPSEQLRALHTEIMKIEREMEVDLAVIQKELDETAYREGAFICDYGFFREMYRLEARRCTRAGTCIHVALLTISLPNGGLPPLKVLNSTTDQLLSMLVSTLRRGDVISKYSSAQFVVLLPSANFEDSSAVIERIATQFNHKNRGNLLKLVYRIRALEGN